MPDFIGGDPESNASECPAVFVIPETGDFVFRGKTITDPALIAELNEHIGKAEDESDVWLPARMAPFIRDALDGYEQGRHGPGQHTFAELLAATQASVIRFEMRDSYDEAERGFAEWKATGDTGAYDWGDHLDVIRAAVARGVTIRRVRIVSEPLSDYLRWEHACTAVNIEAGEDIRWLPRTKAADLMLPGADCFVFDHRVVRWNFQRGDGTNPATTLSARTPGPSAISSLHSRWPGTGQPRTPTTSLTETSRPCLNVHRNLRRLRAKRYKAHGLQTGQGPAPAAREVREGSRPGVRIRAVTTDPKITCRKWARGSGPAPSETQVTIHRKNKRKSRAT